MRCEMGVVVFKGVGRAQETRRLPLADEARTSWLPVATRAALATLFMVVVVMSRSGSFLSCRHPALRSSRRKKKTAWRGG